MSKHSVRTTLVGSLTAAMGLFVAGPAAIAATAAPTPGPSCSPAQSGLCVQESAAISATDTVAGEQVTAHTQVHEFDAGATIQDGLASTFIPLAPVVADANGVATVTFSVPAALPVGTHHVVFTGPLNGVVHTATIAFAVVPSAVTGTGAGRGGLPKTGASNVVPLTESGIALVALGSGVLFLVRRRRSPSPLAA